MMLYQSKRALLVNDVQGERIEMTVQESNSTYMVRKYFAAIECDWMSCRGRREPNFCRVIMI